ncbi:ABC transporter permease subunit/CPBP intramembrane protease [Phycisphaera mikurensis]|uniref:Putative ABC transporter permease protein n=1 Tax=Phycisphaera mikurensis (strain NBRC 102666 / KCTC 22515 / FYK2301M01) TaxID=1142394 RepID=I0IFY2_PHYMF|nr:ABC transporter permease subunit/CPBP intramembrane protease [Phycisphaera mikurensis]MBB6440443.1 sodium transport system permease protein [Phycisphaera mikurensis]BAM04170.1 putative ABC transporter permease protein [Phycisphaera mikurensis NBRC 102666]
MNLHTILTIAAKELRETLRDRRTLMAMVGIPLLLYPVILLAGTQAIVYRQAKTDGQVARVAVAEDLDGQLVERLRAAEGIELEAETAGSADRVASGDLDATVRGTGEADGTETLELLFDSTVPRSAAAQSRIRDVVANLADERITERLEEAGLPPGTAQPFRVETRDAAPARKRAGNLLGNALPMLMILMLGLGAFYPAVDLTAGEKERGTFETLLSTPTAKGEIVWGKFLAVVGLSLATGLLNLGSMAVTLWFQLAQLQAAGAGNAGGGPLDLASLTISPLDLGVMLLILVPLAVFISAAMMSLALLAREFKEASNYLSPFFLLMVAPAALVVAAGVELDGAVVLVPIANATLLFKNLLMSTATWPQVLGTFVSTAVAAVAALRLAVLVFGREDVVLAGDGGLPASLKRSSWPRRRVPTATLSLAAFAVGLLVYVNLGSLLQAEALLPGLIASQWMILVPIAVGALWLFKVDVAASLKLRLPRPGAIAGAVLMACGGLVLSQQLAWVQSFVLDVPEAFAGGTAPIVEHPSLALVLFAVAVSPAVCEEVFFRGTLLAGLEEKLRPWVAIVLASLLFGLFHLYLHRILITAALGIAITWVAWRSRSIWPGMLFHLINNGVAVLAVREVLPPGLMGWLERVAPVENGYPWPVVAAAAAVFAAGAAVVARLGRPRAASSLPGATPARA